MDLTQSIEPKSDQLNADDLLSGPRTFTIAGVDAGNVEQPVNVHLTECPGRPWRPSKSMRRVLVQAWGKEADAYTGRRVTLYRNPDITFGRDKVGGIEVSHLSHVEKRLVLALTVKRGKKRSFTVEPLPDETPTSPPMPAPAQEARDWRAEAEQADGDVDTLRALWTEAQHAGAGEDILSDIRSMAS